MTRSIALLLLFFFCLFGIGVCAGDDVYVFKGDPYGQNMDPKEQIEAFSIGGIFSGSKYRTIVYAPKVPGTYAVFFFVGGLAGIVPAEFYTDLLRRISSKGFVVTALDHFLGGIGSKGGLEQLEYLKKHLQSQLDKHVQGVYASWDHVGLGGHSGGAQTVLDMVLANHTVAKATLFLEGGWIGNPFSHKPQPPITFQHPSLIYNNQYSTHHSFVLPQCGLAGQGERLYSNWTCPRVSLNVTGFGHCDMLDDLGWNGCHLTNFCYTVKDNDRKAYRTFVQGLFSAFLISYVQGYEPASVYYLDTTKYLGLKVSDFQADVNCSLPPISENK